MAFNFFIDFCFLLDILINFRTTYFNPRTGDEISDTKLIAWSYFKSRFWLDLIPTIPFDYVFLGIIRKEVATKF